MRILVAAVVASALLSACHWWHHEKKGENDFVEEVEAADPGNKPQGTTLATISIEVGVVMAEMPRELATEIFGKPDWDGMTLSANGVPDIDALAGAHAAVELISRPKIQTQSGVAAEIASANRVAYVKDYEMGEKGTVRPIHDAVEEGIWLTATPNLDTTLELVDLEYAIRRTVIQRPIAEKPIVVGDRRLTVAVPVASTTRASGHKHLLSGQTVAIDASAMDSPDSKPDAKSDSKSSANARVTLALITVNFWNP